MMTPTILTSRSFAPFSLVFPIGSSSQIVPLVASVQTHDPRQEPRLAASSIVAASLSTFLIAFSSSAALSAVTFCSTLAAAASLVLAFSSANTLRLNFGGLALSSKILLLMFPRVL
jgi:hypothetical protein